MDLLQMIKTAKDAGGGDLHLRVGAPPMVRKNKRLVRLDMPALQESDLQQVIESQLSAQDRTKFTEARSFEKNVFQGDGDGYRLTLYQVQGHPAIIIRMIRPVPSSLDKVGIPPVMLKAVNATQGLFILAGPARSGISTTLAALVEAMNIQRGGHILIIEDPIEFFFAAKNAHFSHRQLNKDIKSIEQGINFAKKIGVDVIVIGDIKREVPFRPILEYVDGGHTVILTMQTLGVQNTLEKISLSYPEYERDHVHQMLGTNLVGVMSQALLVDPVTGEAQPVHEILLMNNAIREILTKGKLQQIEPNMRSAGAGSQLFDQAIGPLVRDGKISRELGEGFLAMYKGLRG